MRSGQRQPDDCGRGGKQSLELWYDGPAEKVAIQIRSEALRIT
jgi:hypothetical protein